MIVESPALRQREREILERYSLSLAALLAERETGARRDDIQPRVVANALMGAHRSLIDFSRARVIARERGPKLRRAVLDQGRRGLAALDQGLGDYARRRSGARRSRSGGGCAPSPAGGTPRGDGTYWTAMLFVPPARHLLRTKDLADARRG
jgi:hypothetical protein